MEYTNIILEHIKEEMKLKGVSQTEVANVLHISSSSLSKRLNGNTTVEFELIMTIANYLGFTINDVFHDEPKNSDIKITVEVNGTTRVLDIKLDD